MEGDFPAQASWVRRWFGVQEHVILSVPERNLESLLGFFNIQTSLVAGFGTYEETDLVNLRTIQKVWIIRNFS